MPRQRVSGPFPAGQVGDLMNLMDQAMRIGGQYQARMNRADQYSPYGAITYEQGDDGQWTARQTLSRPEQRLYDRQTHGQNELAALANRQIRTLDAPHMSLNAKNLPSILRKRGNAALAMAYGNLPTGPVQNPVENMQREATHRAFNSQWRYQGRVFDNDLRALETRLANQGITRGSKAFTREMERFDDNRNRAVAALADQAYMTGETTRRNALADTIATRQQAFGELGQLFGQQAQGRQQLFNERQARIDNELRKVALTHSMQRAPQLPTGVPMPGVGVQQTDAGGAFGNILNRNQFKDNQKTDMFGTVLGAVMPFFR